MTRITCSYYFNFFFSEEFKWTWDIAEKNESAEYSTVEVDVVKSKERKTEEHHTPEDKVYKSKNTDYEKNVESERIPKDIPEKDEIPKMSAADTQEHGAIADASRTGAIPKRYKVKSENITKPKKDTEDTKTESAVSPQDVVGPEDKNKTFSKDTTDKSTGPSNPEVQTQQRKTATIPLDSKPTLSLTSTAAIILKALKMETGGLDMLFFHLTTYIVPCRCLESGSELRILWA